MRELLPSEFPVKRSPWGAIDIAQELATGITRVVTPGHGGIHLSRLRLNALPDFIRRECMDGAFAEEDNCWAGVALCFPEAFSFDNIVAAHVEMINTFPNAFEEYYGVKIADGVSRSRNDAAFERETFEKFLPRAAWGDWEKTTPKGFVKVLAKRASDGAEKYVLIPKEEYMGRVICDGYPETTPADGAGRT